MKDNAPLSSASSDASISSPVDVRKVAQYSDTAHSPIQMAKVLTFL
jgi:hypothetical protein